MKNPELPPFDVSRSEFPDSSTNAYVLSMSLLHQQRTEGGGSPNGKVANLVRRSGTAWSGAFAERVVDDHVISDQDVESFLGARSRHLHGDHVALGMG